MHVISLLQLQSIQLSKKYNLKISEKKARHQNGKEIKYNRNYIKMLMWLFKCLEVEAVKEIIKKRTPIKRKEKGKMNVWMYGCVTFNTEHQGKSMRSRINTINFQTCT